MSLSSAKDFLPILTPIFPSLSFLISAWPDFASEIAVFKSSVTDPNLGLGIKPFGPSTFPNLESFIIIEGVQISFSKFNSPFLIFSIKSSPPTKSAPADFALDDFIQKINSDLIGKFINIGSRTQNFLVKLNNSEIAAGNIIKSESFKPSYQEIIDLVDRKEYSKALKNIMVIADKINAYVSNQEPWNKAKNGEEDKCIEICSEALNVFKDLTILLQPFIPSIAEKIFKLLNTKTLNYDDLSKDNLNKVQKFQPFITRLEKNDFDGILD